MIVCCSYEIGSEAVRRGRPLPQDELPSVQDAVTMNTAATTEHQAIEPVVLQLLKKLMFTALESC